MKLSTIFMKRPTNINYIYIYIYIYTHIHFLKNVAAKIFSIGQSVKEENCQLLFL